MKTLPALTLLFLSATLHAASPSAHVVVKGDTLHGIARKHQCAVSAIKEANGLQGDLIRIGQTLTLPVKSAGDSRVVPQQEAVAKPVKSTKSPALAEQLKALPAVDRMKVQLFLDDALFAPGKVDGLAGEFTTKAAERWIAADEQRDVSGLIEGARETIAAIEKAFTIPTSAAKFIGVVPEKIEEKAAAETLPYETLAEYTAERFHTDLSTLRRLNPGVDLSALKVGDKIQVPAVTPFLIETWPQAGLSARKGPEGRRLRICHDERMIEVVEADGTLRAAFPITVSPKPEHRRSGEWFIRSLAANPSFLWDDELLKNGVKGAVRHLLPPGPNNPVGILWLEIEPVEGPEAHIGIHGTAEPARIGRNHSSGCIRLVNWDIVRLAELVGRGTRVTWDSSVVPSSPTLAVAVQR